MVSTPQIASSSGSDSKDGQIGRERPDNHNAPFHAQLNSIPQSFDRGATHPTQPYEPHLPFDMSGMGNSLPNTVPAPMPPRRYHQQSSFYNPSLDLTTQSPSSMAFPSAQVASIHGLQNSRYGSQQLYGIPGMLHQQSMAGLPPMQQPHTQYSQFSPFPGPYQPQAAMLPQTHGASAGSTPVLGSLGRFDGFAVPQIPTNYPGVDPRLFAPGQGVAPQYPPSFLDTAFNRRMSDSGPTPSYPRGPPRKPKQSGHALWVGNLPPNTTILDLKDHFSRDATKDIESLFLIAKSNCAFVNYRTEAACAAAAARFHETRFNGTRLVCRLRRGSVAPGGQPSPDKPPVQGVPEGAVLTDGISASPQLVVSSASQITATLGEQQGETVPDRVTLNLKVPEKYFIVKSLTMQDLEASVQNGVWATQTHNEEALNKAFEAADNVYLIFSANKSGEYYGYARMTSPIVGSPVALNVQPQTPVRVDLSDGPKTIPTPATETAPKGHIIDDSARGTIFWEAETADFEQDLPKKGGESGQEEDLQQDQDWGRPFSIEWISTNRLPFYRTRGLRNPWNANREVKIARDGTELEPSVGKRLVQMFHRIAQPHAGAAQGTPQAFVQTQSY